MAVIVLVKNEKEFAVTYPDDGQITAFEHPDTHLLSVRVYGRTRRLLGLYTGISEIREAASVWESVGSETERRAA